jgi:glycosyltransferase involved in cell wall biosynthesis
MKIVALIPAYNEAPTIRDVASRTLAQVRDVIVIDDGSSDGTRAELHGLPVTLVSNPVNLGKGASLWRGFALALAEGADAVVTLDGDDQHRPEDIPRLVAAAAAHPERIIIGARLWDRDKVPPLRYIGNRFANFWVAWGAGFPVADSQSGFRLYPAEVLRSIRVAHGPGARFAFESEILIEAGRAGVGSAAVPIPALYPLRARPSHYRTTVDTLRIAGMIFWKLLSRGFDLPRLVRSLSLEKIERGGT